jgi:hypothetical protein
MVLVPKVGWKCEFWNKALEGRGENPGTKLKKMIFVSLFSPLREKN